MEDHKRIGRRVYTTKGHCIMYDKDNQRKEFDFELPGYVSTLERCCTKVKHELKINNVLVTDFSCESRYYSMPVTEFIKHADKITE